MTRTTLAAPRLASRPTRAGVPALAAAGAFALTLTGCLYTNVTAPLSYGSATPGDANGSLGAEVSGSACNYGILWLVAFGNGGYEGAVRNARAETKAAFLVDVKSDTTYTNILFGAYQKQCTEITARVPGPAPAAAAAAPAGGK
jgi:hypothetical protein